MKLKAASALAVCEPTARVQPPDIEVNPSPWPSLVGILAKPMVSSHSGQGLSPEIQVPGIHEPSMAIASLPWGRSSVDTRLPTEASRAMSSDGPSPSE